jgi:hypothetical protein
MIEVELSMKSRVKVFRKPAQNVEKRQIAPFAHVYQFLTNRS